MENKLGALWIALALHKAEETLTIAAVSITRENAEQDARDRSPPDASILCVDMLGGGKGFARKISLWLAENDVVGAENTELVRNIAAEIKKRL